MLQLSSLHFARTQGLVYLPSEVVSQNRAWAADVVAHLVLRPSRCFEPEMGFVIVGCLMLKAPLIGPGCKRLWSTGS